jgi:hypothetical protein
MYQDSDWIKALSRLSKLTLEGVLTWKPTELHADELPEPTDRFIRGFQCEYKGKRYRVFEVSSRHYFDEDSFYWFSQHYLEIFIIESAFSAEFVARSSPFPAAADLFRTIERAYAHQKGALDDLLGSEDSDDGT